MAILLNETFTTNVSNAWPSDWVMAGFYGGASANTAYGRDICRAPA